MKTQEEIYEECKSMHTAANYELRKIEDKLRGMYEQRAYQKGLHDAAYTILNLFETEEAKK